MVGAWHTSLFQSSFLSLEEVKGSVCVQKKSTHRSDQKALNESPVSYTIQVKELLTCKPQVLGLHILKFADIPVGKVGDISE
jgi:hypothetical protein